MKKFIKVLDKIGDILNYIISKFVMTLLSIMIGVVTLQIIAREFFTAFSWTEELSRYLLVWGSFFAATIAYKKGSHIAITFVVNLFNEKTRRIVKLTMDILSSIFFVVMIYFGFKMISLQIYQTSPAMQIPMRLVYLCIPLSGIIMLYYNIEEIIGRDLKKEEENG